MSDCGSKPQATYRRIVMTGGSGFVGSHLAPRLVEAFPDADRLLLGLTPPRDEPAGWRCKIGDLTDGAATFALIRNYEPDLVVHMAAQSSVGAAVGSAEITWRANVLGTLELASACTRLASQPTFFFTSSSEVYGHSFVDGPVDEDTPLRPTNAYARSKAVAETMLADVLPVESRLIVVRPFNHTGPGQDQRFVLPSLAAQIAAIEIGAQRPELRMGNQSVRRDFLDVRDVCSAYVGLLQKPWEAGSRLVFNVSSGTSYPIAHLVEMMRQRSTRAFNIVVDPDLMRPSDIPVAEGSARRLCEATGWRPTTSIESIVDELMLYWRRQSSARQW